MQRLSILVKITFNFSANQASLGWVQLSLGKYLDLFQID